MNSPSLPRISAGCPREKKAAYTLPLPKGNGSRSGERKSFAGTFSLDQIVAHGGYIYRIEKDHSLVICRDDNLAELARVYFFDNGEWMALSGKGRHYFYSSGARELFTVYKVRN